VFGSWRCCDFGITLATKFELRNQTITDVIITFWRFRSTANKRIAYVAFFARTNWDVIVYATTSVQAARAGARILTLLIDAGKTGLAFGVDSAFGSAIRRHADERRRARTTRYTVYVSALRVRAARRRYARIRWWLLLRSRKGRCKLIRMFYRRATWGRIALNFREVLRQFQDRSMKTNRLRHDEFRW